MKRDPANPIITAQDIPAFMPALRDPSSVFNPGAIRHDDGYDLLILRVQTRGRETVFVPAAVTDEGSVEFFDGIANIEGLQKHSEHIHHIYDPRLTRLEDTVYMVMAIDVTTPDGVNACRLGMAQMITPTSWQLVGVETSRDSRNGVLFPQKIQGRYHRLERPNEHQLEDGPKTGSTIYTAMSDDLVTWELGEPVMSGRWHYWDELIGSGPPPVLTDSGWLHIYHGVATHFSSSNIYQAGVCILDPDNPGVVVQRGAMNILEPRELYELTGQVPNVVFPSGMVVDENSESVRVYYGAADTCVGMVNTMISELVTLCHEPGMMH